ncbi:MAG: S-methyl-5-thioribose-1-phosphate isomerase [Cyanobacteria bacterium]|nr:S-methyl-5-thioribose-1-phosphate isomerase [Cyanobacteriota bacterium]MDW8201294.1 S-methyl-5-thioribose-1-phosphate isomerase [Cyanobacteriota bacterium SKYGB_h_bin112]
MTPPIQIRPVFWYHDHVLLIDQTHLPTEYRIVEIRRFTDMVEAIQMMIVRGAPAIGIAAAYGMYLGAREVTATNHQDFLAALEHIADSLRATRPTAVNLFWAIDQMLTTARQVPAPEDRDEVTWIAAIQTALFQAADKLCADDLQTCLAIGEQGLAVLPKEPERLRLLTHCNAGALATAGYGTALGVVRSAWNAGRLERLYADETRPRLQGARLTTWECYQEGIPVTLITDNMAAHCMQKGLVDAVVVGADRIAANGDTANKIGTYSLALIAKAHAIPFFVAAPRSTIDISLSDGSQIPIEEREASELYQIGDTRICPKDIDFYNPAFDVTPADLITAIITEAGAVAPDRLADIY